MRGEKGWRTVFLFGKRKVVLPVSLLLICGAVIGSCGGEDCVINNTVTATMTFYLSDGNACQVNDTLTVTVVRADGDSVVLNRKTGATGLTFPLGYTNACDTFIFRFARMGVADSVFIRHDNHPWFISLDCGTAMFHTITGADCTHHLMQSVQIKDAEINYDAKENVQIIFGD